MRRLCLFAGYNADGVFDNYAVQTMQVVDRYADIFYLADNNPNEVCDIENFKMKTGAKFVWLEKHNEYDFGSWKRLLSKKNAIKFSQYDWVWLVNDSNCGPLYDIYDIVHSMESTNADFWGITENYGGGNHLQSYFLCLRWKQPFIAAVLDFFSQVTSYTDKQDVVEKYEIHFTQSMLAKGFKKACAINRNNSSIPIPFEADITTYQNALLTLGSPFIKKKVFIVPGFACESIYETLETAKKYAFKLSCPIAPDVLEENEKIISARAGYKLIGPKLEERNLDHAQLILSPANVINLLPSNSVCAYIGDDNSFQMHLQSIGMTKEFYSFREENTDFLQQQPDNYFDFIYYCGSKRYDFVKHELNILETKIKTKKYLYIQNYIFYSYMLNEEFGVQCAVNEFLNKTSHKIIAYCLDCQHFDSILLKLHK